MSGLKQERVNVTERTETEVTEFRPAETTKIIVSARPGLSSEESALMRSLPQSYREGTVKDVLSYLVDANVKDDEVQTATSLRNELGAAGSVITINGRRANLTDKIVPYLQDKKKKVGEREINYQALEIEVNAVQQGGYRFNF